MAKAGRLVVELDATEAHEELNRLVERIASIEIPEVELEELTEQTLEFPWWLLFVSAFAGGLAAFLIFALVVMVFA